MRINFSRDDYLNLADMLARVSTFAAPVTRYDFVQNLLVGQPDADALRQQVTVGIGPAPHEAQTITRQLLDFGADSAGKSALVLLILSLQRIVSGEDRAKLDELLARYPLVAPPPCMPNWNGTEKAADTREKAVGENTLQHVRVAQMVLRAARSVVQVRAPAPNGSLALGSGSLIAPGWIMTNHHVLNSPADAALAVVLFNYQLAEDGREEATVTARLSPQNAGFFSHAELDYTCARLDLSSLPPDFPLPPSLPLSRHIAQIGERVSIIQHPGYGGQSYKQFAINNNLVQASDAHSLQYTTTTMRGSSGSPIFDIAFRMIGLHHSGGNLIDPGDGLSYWRNAGTTLAAILDDLAPQAQQNGAEDLSRAIKAVGEGT